MLTPQYIIKSFHHQSVVSLVQNIIDMRNYVWYSYSRVTVYIHVGLLLLVRVASFPGTVCNKKLGRSLGTRLVYVHVVCCCIHGRRSVVVYIYVGLLFVVTRCCCCPKLLVVTRRYSWSFRICWTLSCTEWGALPSMHHCLDILMQFLTARGFCRVAVPTITPQLHHHWNWMQ